MAKSGPKARTTSNSAGKKVAGPLWAGHRPPAHLSEGALAEFHRVVGALGIVGTLDKTDPRMVELYAINYDLVHRAHRQIDADGLTVETAEGRPILHPLMGVINAATIRLRGLMNDMGLTPASHNLTDPQSEAGPSDPWSGILNVHG
ncbi:MAG: phage terminase small subunit P27 family [Isosphaeraceae bacterium]